MACALKIYAIKRLRKTQNVFGTGNNCAIVQLRTWKPEQTRLPVSVSFQALKGKLATGEPQGSSKRNLAITMVRFNTVAFLYPGPNTFY
jgi:hypothetical protein